MRAHEEGSARQLSTWDSKAQTQIPQHASHQQYNRDSSDPRWLKKGRPLPDRPLEGMRKRLGTPSVSLVLKVISELIHLSSGDNKSWGRKGMMSLEVDLRHVFNLGTGGAMRDPTSREPQVDPSLWKASGNGVLWLPFFEATWDQNWSLVIINERNKMAIHTVRGRLESPRTPMMAFSSVIVTCLARSTACATCCWCWREWKGLNAAAGDWQRVQERAFSLSSLNPFQWACITFVIKTWYKLF